MIKIPYSKSLDEDIKLIHESDFIDLEENDAKTLNSTIFGLLSAVNMGIGLGAILNGLAILPVFLFSTCTEFIIISNAEKKEKRIEELSRSEYFKAYNASERIKEISAKLYEKGVNVTKDEILNTTDVHVIGRIKTPIGYDIEEEHLMFLDPYTGEHISQNIKKLKYLRNKVIIYGNLVYKDRVEVEDECEKIKVKS